MNEAIVLLGLIWMTCIGYVIIKFFRLLDNSSDIEKLPYSFGLGAGVVAIQLYLYSRLHVSWNIFFLLLPWILFLILFFRIKTFWTHPAFVKNIKLVDKILIFFIITLFLFVLLESIIRPVTAWDGWASWLLRAKIFFIDGSIRSDVFSYIPSEYPLLASLMSTFIYIFLGVVDDRTVLLLYPAFYIFLSMLFYFSSRRLLGNTSALFFTFLLISTQNVIRHSGRYEAGQADLIQGFYIFASSLLFVVYLRSKSLGNMILLQIFLGITSLIKNEGVSFVIFTQVLLAIFLLRKKLYKHFFSFLFWIIPFVDWQLFKFFHQLPKAPSYLHSSFHLERLPLILEEFTREFFNIQNWNLLWPVFFLSFFVFLFSSKRNIYTLALYLLIFLQLWVYMGIFFFTSPNPALHIPNVADRALLHLAPSAVYAVSISFFMFYNKYEKQP